MVIGLNAPSWTPDRKWIVFFHRITQVPHAPRLLHTVLDERGSLVPISDAATISEMIALLDVETGMIRSFPGPDISRTWGFRLSPDGEHVAFLAAANRLHKDKPANWVCLTVLDFNSGEFQTIGTEQPDGWELSLSWSPDDRHIAWRAVSGYELEKLIIANVAASSILEVPLPLDADEGRLDFPSSELKGPPAPPLWSVDGASFWIPGKDALLHFAVDGTRLVDVPLPPGGGCDWLINACPSFAPVSTQQVPDAGEFYVVRPSRIEHVKLATETVHVVLSEAKITDRWIGMERAFDRVNSIVYTVRGTVARGWELLQTDLIDGMTSKYLLLSPGADWIETGEIRLLKWKLDDGADCSGALLLPNGWKEGDTPPVVMDVYGDFRGGGRYATQDFDDASNIINPRLLGLHGYAFFKPDMPQTDEEPAQSLVSSGEAAAAALRASGYVNADRIGVIGQSYGGYTTLCLLTGSQMFKAGIVANGIYDLIRIATGYGEAWYVEGGQGRMHARLWDDPLRYIINSPLYALDMLDTPLLILQGGGDSHTSNQSPLVLTRSCISGSQRKWLWQPIWAMSRRIGAPKSSATLSRS